MRRVSHAAILNVQFVSSHMYAIYIFKRPEYPEITRIKFLLIPLTPLIESSSFGLYSGEIY